MREALCSTVVVKYYTNLKKPYKILLVVLGVLIIAGVVAFCLWRQHDPEMVFSEFAKLPAEDTGQVRGNDGSNPGAEDDYRLPLTINIVFLGLDRTEQVERFNRQEISDRVQPDAIIYASLDIREQKVKAISISRDSKVPIIGMELNDKINHAYYYGSKYGSSEDDQGRAEEGIRFTLETIANLMGAPVDFYVVIDIDDLIKIVDMMGGVYYDVERDIRADLGQGRVLIEKGYQHLDGEHFFYYIQYRDVYGSNHDRMDRQQRIIESTFKQYRDTGKLTKIPAVIAALHKSTVTNLNNRQIGALLRFAGELEVDAINFYSFAGEGIFTEYGYYFYIDEEQRAAVLKEMLGVEVKSMGIVKGVPFDFEAEDEEAELNIFQGSFWDNEPLFSD